MSPFSGFRLGKMCLLGEIMGYNVGGIMGRLHVLGNIVGAPDVSSPTSCPLHGPRISGHILGEISICLAILRKP